MYTTKNNLSEGIRTQICDMLQEHLANSLDLATQAKQAHWNVKGPDFISLHELFDKVAASSSEYVDLIAERIVQLGGMADGSLASAAKRSKLPSYPLNISSGHDHVNALAQTLGAYAQRVHDAILEADDLVDQATADIFTQVLREVDKYLWFVEAHVQATR